MDVVERAASIVGQARPTEPVGTVKVVDPSPSNWLWITYNVVEELVRVDGDGTIEPAAMSRYRWVDDTTLEVVLREGNRFPDGTLLTSASVRQAFEEMFRWDSPHPPGTHFNLDPRTTLEVVDEGTVRFHLPEPDGFALGKLRAMHLMTDRFWQELGFGYLRHLSGEGHW